MTEINEAAFIGAMRAYNERCKLRPRYSPLVAWADLGDDMRQAIAAVYADALLAVQSRTAVNGLDDLVQEVKERLKDERWRPSLDEVLAAILATAFNRGATYRAAGALALGPSYPSPRDDFSRDPFEPTKAKT